MNKGKKHIDLQKQGDYPVPGIPADDAWDNMKDMLDQQMPQSPKNPANWLSTIKVISTALILSVGILYLFKNQIPFFQDQSATQTRHPSLQENPRHEIHFANPDTKAEKNETSNPQNNKTSTNSKQEATDSKEIIPSNNHAANLTTHSNRTKAPTNKENIQTDSLFENITSETEQRYGVIHSSKVSDKSDLSLPKAGNRDGLYTHYTVTEADGNQQLVPKAISNAINNQFKNTSISTQNQSVSTSTNSTLVHEVRAIDALVNKPFQTNNRLAVKLNTIQILQKKSLPISKEVNHPSSVFKNMGGGLLWNLNAPATGYNQYAKYSNASHDIYKHLIPGIWFGPTFKNGSKVFLKVLPFGQHDGNASLLDSNRQSRADSIGGYFVYTERRLGKTSGFNLGIQFNQPLYQRWRLGIGANMQKQKTMLIHTVVKSSRANNIVDEQRDDILSQKYDTLGYIKPYLFTTNVELLYQWNRIEFGAGAILPITSILAIPDKRFKPLNFQIAIKWQIR